MIINYFRKLRDREFLGGFTTVKKFSTAYLLLCFFTFRDKLHSATASKYLIRNQHFCSVNCLNLNCFFIRAAIIRRIFQVCWLLHFNDCTLGTSQRIPQQTKFRMPGWKKGHKQTEKGTKTGKLACTNYSCNRFFYDPPHLSFFFLFFVTFMGDTLNLPDNGIRIKKIKRSHHA